MADPQLIDYIKKARQANQQDNQSRTLLTNNGWSEAEINDAFASLDGGAAQPAAPIESIEPKIEPQLEPQVQPQMQSRFQPEPLQPEKMETQVKIQRPEIQTQAQQDISRPTMEMPSQNAGFGQRKKSHALLTTLIILIILAVVGGGGYFALAQTGLLENFPKFSLQGILDKFIPNMAIVPPAETPVQEQPQNTNIFTTSFGQYILEATRYTAVLPDYTLDLANVTNLTDFEKANGNLSENQKSALLENNFFVVRNLDKDFYSSNPEAQVNRNDDWTNLYGRIGGSPLVWEREPQNSVFISSDFLTHVYHKLLDQEFTYIEENNLYPTLNELSQALLKSSANAYTNEANQDQKDSYERLSAYFLVTSAILNNASADFQKFQTQNYIDDSKTDTKNLILAGANVLAKENGVSDGAKNIATQEINLILDAKLVTPSPLMGKYQENMREDYTQFLPRSHYAKNVILRDYFRAMMFYGRMNFLLKSPELTRDAANLTSLFTADQLTKWQSIYEPTSFFVGQSDDLNISNYNQAITKIRFTSSAKDSGVITQLQNELLTYQNPQIMSSIIVSTSVPDTTKEDLQNTTKGFRFMGQRFTPDAFVFSTLTQGDEKPDEKTGQSLPSMPTSLMFSTLVSGQNSSPLLTEWIKNNAPNSDKVIADRMNSLQQYFTKITPQQWNQNVYWSWLYTIKSLLADTLNKSGFPMFMKNQAWATKNLNAFLGSWTELKHDTLLYAKQSYAELGAGGPEEQPAKPVPKGYVEPNIEFLDRLIALTNFTTNGLKKFNVLPENLATRNDRFIESVKFYRQIAVAELQNQQISDEDFEKLRMDAGQLDNILQTPDSQVTLEKNSRSAIVADVHTDACNKNKDTGKCTGVGQILYEGDGIPNYIYVAVSDANGTRLTKGLVYSYYEFTGPLSTRFTDQIWQGWNYSNTISKLKLPLWTSDIIK